MDGVRSFFNFSFYSRPPPIVIISHHQCRKTWNVFSGRVFWDNGGKTFGPILCWWGCVREFPAILRPRGSDPAAAAVASVKWKYHSYSGHPRVRMHVNFVVIGNDAKYFVLFRGDRVFHRAMYLICSRLSWNLLVWLKREQKSPWSQCNLPYNGYEVQCIGEFRAF